MSDNSKIERTDATWNPLRAVSEPYESMASNGRLGWYCERVSPGCEHCYAEAMNRRLGTGLPFKPGHRKDVEIFLDEKTLLAPLRWKKPRMIFVCSITDLFGEWVKDEWLDRIFAVMANCFHHTFQVLTKRPDRMKRYMCGTWPHPAAPLDNVWLGTSAEDQDRADERIPTLLDTPAAVRFVSLEPLLSDVRLHPLACGTNALSSSTGPNLNWVIVGGESGPGARPMREEWAESLRDQCRAAGVPFFMKQMAKKAPIPQHLMIREMPHDR